MSLTLKPYQRYKDSGQKWIGQVPTHWEVLPNRALFKERIAKGHPDEQMLSVTIKRGVIRQAELLRDTSKKDSSNENKGSYKLVIPGDIAYNKMRAWQGAVGTSALRGIISPAYIVQTLRGPDNSEFFHYLLRTPAFATEAERWSYGITSDQWSLRSDDFKQIYCQRPSRGEQDDIVKFLKRAEKRINQLIRAKRRIIELLNEQKQVVLQKVVASTFVSQLPQNVLGLPQTVGKIKGWESYYVRHLLQLKWLEIQDGNHGELHPKSTDYVDEGIPFLMANDVRPEGLNLLTCAKISEPQARSLRIGFARPGDVLLTHKATIGQVGMVPSALSSPFVMLTPQVTYYRSKVPQISQDYLYVYMQSAQFQEQLHLLSLNQSTRPYIGLLEQRNLVISFPSPERQAAISAEYRETVSQLNDELRLEKLGIDYIREYRTRLITDVVTGKLDVRGVELPELEGAEEIESLSDVADEELEDSEELVAADGGADAD